MAFGSSSSSMVLGKEEEDDENQEQVVLEEHAHVQPTKRRNHRIPHPDVEIIALSPTTLMAKNRFICEICLKGFPREQNLQLDHKRGHNLPWKLKQKIPKDEVKRKAYICPEPSCIHHDRSHSLGDLTGIKKHYSRKHGEKKYKCQKCAKMYAVQSDLKAHTKICGKKEYQCQCGTFFSRRDSFTLHKAFCEALANSRNGALLRHPTALTPTGVGSSITTQMSLGLPDFRTLTSTSTPSIQNLIHTSPAITVTKGVTKLGHSSENSNCYKPPPPFLVSSLDQENPYKYIDNFMGSHMNSGNAAMMPQLSATSLLHKASLHGSTWSNNNSANNFAPAYTTCFSSGPSDCGIGIRNIDSNGGSSMLNLNAGVTYEQEDRCHVGVSSRSGGYNDDENMIFQQSGGASVTRDFLGVGAGVNLSSDGPESTVVGRSFL